MTFLNKYIIFINDVMNIYYIKMLYNDLIIIILFHFHTYYTINSFFMNLYQIMTLLVKFDRIVLKNLFNYKL